MRRQLQTNPHVNYAIIIFTILFGVVFYDLIRINSGFSYTDEILAIILFLHFLQCKKSTEGLKEFMYFGVIAMFYLIHSMLYPHNVNPAILTDFFIQIKPYIAFYSVYCIRFDITPRGKKRITNICKICSILMLPIGLINPGGGEIMDMFGGHARYATIAIVLGTTYLIFSQQQKKDIIITIIIYSIGLLSLRSKMFGFYTASIFILLVLGNISFRKLYSIKNIIFFMLMLAVILYVSKDKIIFYFVEGSQYTNIYARPLLYMGAFEILKDYPFFGTGFGSYATFASGEYYSPLYYTYELYLSPEIGKGLYISDTFFPVFAQFGYIGLFLFIYFWIRRVKKAKENLSKYNNKLYFKIVMLIIIFFFIESIADSTFTHNRGMAMLMLLALILNDRNSFLYNDNIKLKYYDHKK